MKKVKEKLYGLIGYPLGHSFSQNYFNSKFEAEGISARYMNFELPDIGDLMEVLSEHPNLDGLNVTIPYKEQVMAYLDDIDPVAQRIGAVNVIQILRGKSDSDMRLVGFNSDIAGFTNSIRPFLRPYHKAALVLGTGGASKAICCGLEDLGIIGGHDHPCRAALARLLPDMLDHRLAGNQQQRFARQPGGTQTGRNHNRERLTHFSRRSSSVRVRASLSSMTGIPSRIG